MKRHLKLHWDFPYNLEMILRNKYGYNVGSTEFQKLRNFSKDYITDSEPSNIIYVGTMLPKHRENELAKRCDRIVDFFPDPYSVPDAVRARLRIMAQSLQLLPERQFVLEYMDENFPLELLEDA